MRVCVCVCRGERVGIFSNSFNVLSTALYVRDTAVQRTSVFLPQEVPALVREDRHSVSQDKFGRCSAFCERRVRSSRGTCGRGACLNPVPP